MTWAFATPRTRTCATPRAGPLARSGGRRRLAEGDPTEDGPCSNWCLWMRLCRSCLDAIVQAGCCAREAAHHRVARGRRSWRWTRSPRAHSRRPRQSLPPAQRRALPRRKSRPPSRPRVGRRPPGRRRRAAELVGPGARRLPRRPERRPEPGPRPLPGGGPGLRQPARLRQVDQTNDTPAGPAWLSGQRHALTFHGASSPRRAAALLTHSRPVLRRRRAPLTAVRPRLPRRQPPSTPWTATWHRLGSACHGEPAGVVRDFRHRGEVKRRVHRAGAHGGDAATVAARWLTRHPGGLAPL